MTSLCVALVPENHARRAAMLAVADVEKMRTRTSSLPAFPYAHAFFRHLRGSRRISLRELRLFAPALSEKELRGNKASWLSAVDMLIESRGVCCWLPLPVAAGQEMFPEVVFQRQERQRRQDELEQMKYTRQRSRENFLKERAYRALADQAEVELAFHTPATVSCWSARWSGTALRQYDIEEMFWRWSERFPSLAPLERWTMENQPLWVVMAESDALANESPEAVRQLERWMVPNKLTDRNRV